MEKLLEKDSLSHKTLRQLDKCYGFAGCNAEVRTRPGKKKIGKEREDIEKESVREYSKPTEFNPERSRDLSATLVLWRDDFVAKRPCCLIQC